MAKKAHAAGGIALRSLQWFLRLIEFGCAAVILALFSYFLAKLHTNNLNIPANMKAIEGISGVAVLYTIFAVLLVCCIGGLGFFALLAFILDILFCGGFIYMAIKNDGGAHSCSSGNVNTWLGSGDVNTGTTIGSLPSLKTSCRMETACFAVAVAGAVFFLISAFVEIALWRHHKAEKKYGPSPSNGYTAGSGKQRFWQRKNRGVTATNDDTLPYHATPADARPSHATDNTMVGLDDNANNKYGNAVPLTENKHHIGRDAGLVGAGGAVAAEKHHHDKTRNSTSGTPVVNNSLHTAVPLNEKQHHLGRDAGFVGAGGAVAAERHHHNKTKNAPVETGYGNTTQQYAAPVEPRTTQQYAPPTETYVNPTHINDGSIVDYSAAEIPVSEWRAHELGGSGAFDEGVYTSPRGTAV